MVAKRKFQVEQSFCNGGIGSLTKHTIVHVPAHMHTLPGT